MKMDNHKHSCLSRSRILFHFRIPISTGKRKQIKTELRDPCIMRDGDTYYLVYTHFPFTHQHQPQSAFRT